MRIAYLCADPTVPVFGDDGASVRLQELVRALNRQGHKVHLLAARLGARSGHLPATIESIDLSSAVPGPDDQQPGPGSPGDLEQRLQRLAAAAEQRLLELHREQPFGLVYERCSLQGAGGVRVPRALGVPRILEVDGPLPAERLHLAGSAEARRAAAMQNRLLNDADAVVCVSEEVAEHVRSRAPAVPVQVMTNGVDLDRFTDQADPIPLPGHEQSLVIGFAGSLKRRHGVDVLLDAFARLHRDAPDTHLLFAGDGPMRGFIDGFARGAGLQEAVTVTGWLPHAMMPSVLARMDIATVPYPHPHPADFQHSPLKLFEYLAAGVPVVASRIGALRSVVADGRHGVLCEPGDAADLAQRILYLAGRPALRMALARAGRERVLEYSWQRNAQHLVGLACALRRAA